MVPKPAGHGNVRIACIEAEEWVLTTEVEILYRDVSEFFPGVNSTAAVAAPVIWFDFGVLLDRLVPLVPINPSLDAL